MEEEGWRVRDCCCVCVCCRRWSWATEVERAVICCVRAEIDGSACWAGRAPAGVLGVAERWLLGWAEKAEAEARGGSESKGEKRGRLGGEGAGRVLVVRAGIAERTRSESVATWAERAETCASVRARRARRARYASEDSNSGGVGDIAGGPMAGGSRGNGKKGIRKELRDDRGDRPPEALSGTASPRNLDRAATTAYISHK